MQVWCFKSILDYKKQLKIPASMYFFIRWRILQPTTSDFSSARLLMYRTSPSVKSFSISSFVQSLLSLLHLKPLSACSMASSWMACSIRFNQGFKSIANDHKISWKLFNPKLDRSPHPPFVIVFVVVHVNGLDFQIIFHHLHVHFNQLVNLFQDIALEFVMINDKTPFYKN